MTERAKIKQSPNACVFACEHVEIKFQHTIVGVVNHRPQREQLCGLNIARCGEREQRPAVLEAVTGEWKE